MTTENHDIEDAVVEQEIPPVAIAIVVCLALGLGYVMYKAAKGASSGVPESTKKSAYSAALGVSEIASRLNY